MKKDNANYEQFRDALLASNPEVALEYERLGPRFQAINAMIRARQKEAISQSELARRMSVNANVVSRLESAQHSPRLDTLTLAAEALGYELRVSFVKKQRATLARKPANPRSRTKVATGHTRSSGRRSAQPARA